MIWLFIGLVFGYGIGFNRHRNSTAEKVTETERTRYKQDIEYYKKLTRTLVEENKSLRIENDVYKNPNKKTKTSRT